MARRTVRWIARSTVALLILAGLLLAYGMAIEPRFILDERRLDVAIPGLPDDWAGRQVAVFSDLQVGMWLANEGMVERVVERVVEEEPAAVLLVGDFVYSRGPDVDVQVGAVLDLLEPLTTSRIPMYAVLGNHDYAARAVDELVAGLEGEGIRVLRNEAVELGVSEATGAPLQLVGLGPAKPGRADATVALGGLPNTAPRLVMMHNPTTFPGLPPGTAPFAIAGHTHCGQIALPGSPRWSYLGLTEEEALVADGWAPPEYGASGNRLFVTCGIGFSLVPIRINAAPQVVFLHLLPA